MGFPIGYQSGCSEMHLNRPRSRLRYGWDAGIAEDEALRKLRAQNFAGEK